MGKGKSVWVNGRTRDGPDTGYTARPDTDLISDIWQNILPDIRYTARPDADLMSDIWPNNLPDTGYMARRTLI